MALSYAPSLSTTSGSSVTIKNNNSVTVLIWWSKYQTTSYDALVAASTAGTAIPFTTVAAGKSYDIDSDTLQIMSNSISTTSFYFVFQEDGGTSVKCANQKFTYKTSTPSTPTLTAPSISLIYPSSGGDRFTIYWTNGEINGSGSYSAPKLDIEYKGNNQGASSWVTWYEELTGSSGSKTADLSTLLAMASWGNLTASSNKINLRLKAYPDGITTIPKVAYSSTENFTFEPLKAPTLTSSSNSGPSTILTAKPNSNLSTLLSKGGSVTNTITVSGNGASTTYTWEDSSTKELVFPTSFSGITLPTTETDYTFTFTSTYKYGSYTTGYYINSQTATASFTYTKPTISVTRPSFNQPNVVDYDPYPSFPTIKGTTGSVTNGTALTDIQYCRDGTYSWTQFVQVSGSRQTIQQSTNLKQLLEMASVSKLSETNPTLQFQLTTYAKEDINKQASSNTTKKYIFSPLGEPSLSLSSSSGSSVSFTAIPNNDLNTLLAVGGSVTNEISISDFSVTKTWNDSNSKTYTFPTNFGNPTLTDGKTYTITYTSIYKYGNYTNTQSTTATFTYSKYTAPEITSIDYLDTYFGYVSLKWEPGKENGIAIADNRHFLHLLSATDGTKIIFPTYLGEQPGHTFNINSVTMLRWINQLHDRTWHWSVAAHSDMVSTSSVLTESQPPTTFTYDLDINKATASISNNLLSASWTDMEDALKIVPSDQVEITYEIWLRQGPTTVLGKYYGNSNAKVTGLQISDFTPEGMTSLTSFDQADSIQIHACVSNIIFASSDWVIPTKITYGAPTINSIIHNTATNNVTVYWTQGTKNGNPISEQSHFFYFKNDNAIYGHLATPLGEHGIGEFTVAKKTMYDLFAGTFKDNTWYWRIDACAGINDPDSNILVSSASHSFEYIYKIPSVSAKIDGQTFTTLFWTDVATDVEANTKFTYKIQLYNSAYIARGNPITSSEPTLSTLKPSAFGLSDFNEVVYLKVFAYAGNVDSTFFGESNYITITKIVYTAPEISNFALEFITENIPTNNLLMTFQPLKIDQSDINIGTTDVTYTLKIKNKNSSADTWPYSFVLNKQEGQDPKLFGIEASECLNFIQYTQSRSWKFQLVATYGGSSYASEEHTYEDYYYYIPIETTTLLNQPQKIIFQWYNIHNDEVIKKHLNNNSFTSPNYGISLFGADTGTNLIGKQYWIGNGNTSSIELYPNNFGLTSFDNVKYIEIASTVDIGKVLNVPLGNSARKELATITKPEITFVEDYPVTNPVLAFKWKPAVANQYKNNFLEIQRRDNGDNWYQYPYQLDNILGGWQGTTDGEGANAFNLGACLSIFVDSNVWSREWNIRIKDTSTGLTSDIVKFTFTYETIEVSQPSLNKLEDKYIFTAQWNNVVESNSYINTHEDKFAQYYYQAIFLKTDDKGSIISQKTLDLTDAIINNLDCSYNKEVDPDVVNYNCVTFALVVRDNSLSLISQLATSPWYILTTVESTYGPPEFEGELSSRNGPVLAFNWRPIYTTDSQGNKNYIALADEQYKLIISLRDSQNVTTTYTITNNITNNGDISGYQGHSSWDTTLHANSLDAGALASIFMALYSQAQDSLTLNEWNLVLNLDTYTSENSQIFDFYYPIPIESCTTKNDGIKTEIEIVWHDIFEDSSISSLSSYGKYVIMAYKADGTPIPYYTTERNKYSFIPEESYRGIRVLATVGASQFGMSNEAPIQMDGGYIKPAKWTAMGIFVYDFGASKWIECTAFTQDENNNWKLCIPHLAEW